MPEPEINEVRVETGPGGKVQMSVTVNLDDGPVRINWDEGTVEALEDDE